jgi:hypothetical protein
VADPRQAQTGSRPFHIGYWARRPAWEPWPLLTAFARDIFDTAERVAVTRPGRRLDPPLLGLLDEAPSIAPIPTLPALLANGRAIGIVIVYAMQSFSQAVTRWGSQAATMANATSITAVFGGLTEPRTWPTWSGCAGIAGSNGTRRIVPATGGGRL